MARNEDFRTTGFMCLAFAALIGTGITFWLKQPPAVSEFELVGKPFFETFENSSQATSLKVVALNDDAEQKEFEVKLKDGIWTIPSHHDYPAEAVDRLGQTSASVIGLEREALAGRLKSEHARFGVLNPEDEDVTDPESTGQRLTLLDKDGETLADFIIGNEVEDMNTVDLASADEQPRKYYYVRRKDEDQTFKVQLDIDLSTKFSDWIEPDLLKIGPQGLVRIFLDNYSIEERAGDALGLTRNAFKNDGEQVNLTRPDGTADWELDGLRAYEELRTQRLTEISDVIEDIEIVGVRPKTTFKDKQILTADLQINRDPELMSDPRGFQNAIDRLRGEMQDYGFILAQVERDGAVAIDFLCKLGEIELGTDQGVKYTLMFGNEVAGDANEIEIGGASTDSDDSSESSDSASGREAKETEKKTGDSEAGDEEPVASDTESAVNRYLMVRVEFDDSLLGEEPVKPIEPTAPVKPEGYSEKRDAEQTPDSDAPQVPDADTAPNPDAIEEESKETTNQGKEKETDKEDDEMTDRKEAAKETAEETDAESADKEIANEKQEAEKPLAESDGEEQKQEDDAPKPAELESNAKRDAKFEEYEKALEQYKIAKIEYEVDLSRYEDQINDWKEKISVGEKQVEELNARFGKWFYVISANNLDSVRASRSDLVEQTSEPPTLPDVPNIDFPEVVPNG